MFYPNTLLTTYLIKSRYWEFLNHTHKYLTDFTEVWLGTQHSVHKYAIDKEAHERLEIPWLPFLINTLHGIRIQNMLLIIRAKMRPIGNKVLWREKTRTSLFPEF